MNPKLAAKFDALQRQSNDLFESLAALPGDRYFFQPNGKWSIAQILTHLLIAEKLSLAYMRKKSLGVDTLENSGWVESLKVIALQLSQRMPLRYRAPAVVLENTPEPMAFEAVRSAWISSRENLRQFLDKIDDQHVHKKIYKHPVAGRLDVLQALVFFREHVAHHLPQVKRLL